MPMPPLCASGLRWNTSKTKEQSMEHSFVGELSRDSALYMFLAHEVLEQELGNQRAEAAFDIYALEDGETVFLYAERESGTQLVCKFYGHKMLAGSRTGHNEVRAAFMHKEFAALKYARSLGLDTSRHKIVR